MKLELNEDDIKKLILNYDLTQELADRIIEKKSNKIWDEFDKALIDAIKKATTKIIEEMIENYFLEDDLRNKINKILGDLTREEIIKILSQKNI